MKYPYYDKAGSTIYHGDCLNIMAEMEENSVDAIVVDPPYGISFMGKKWDYKIPEVEIWKQGLRVLKPGGHLLCLAGTRTQHRMAVNIEDAGFEIRDAISYLYSTQDRLRALWETLTDEQRKLFHQVFDVDGLGGWGFGSGFPKSLDIGKKLDQAAGREREVVGTRLGRPGMSKNGSNQSFNSSINTYGKGGILDTAITAPATPEAKQWDGWGSGLKPAIELIIMCRKPLSEKTIAANVLRWGIGAINIDGCRIEAREGELIERSGELVDTACHDGYDRPNHTMFRTGKPKERGGPSNPKGRWPANLILDDSGEVRELFPETKSGRGEKYGNHIYGDFAPKNTTDGQLPDSGSAARFFYSCSQDTICALCGLPCTPKHSIMNETDGEKDAILCNANTVQKNLFQKKKAVVSAQNRARQRGPQEKEGRLGESNAPAGNAEKNLKTTQGISQSTARKIALMKLEKQLAQNVKCAANLCNICAIHIAHTLVEIKTLGFKKEGSLPTLDYIAEPKRQILIQNLVTFAEVWGNIDTIPTTQSLKMLFGYVQSVIEDCTKKEYRNQNGKSEPARFLYCSKSSTAERNQFCEGEDKNTHNTVKPIALMRQLVRLITPPGGLVLDPFCGSGSTLVAAQEEGFKCVGIELEETHCSISAARLRQPSLFSVQAQES